MQTYAPGGAATLDRPATADFETAVANPAVMQPTIRVALPAYNEAESLLPLLESLHATLSLAGLPHEIVVVDDGSKDDTALIASQASFSMPVRLVQHERNQGLAAALRTGLTDAVAHAAPRGSPPCPRPGGGTREEHRR